MIRSEKPEKLSDGKSRSLLVIGRSRIQTANSHVALACAALMSRASSDRRILVTNDQQLTKKQAREPVSGAFENDLRVWAEKNGISVRVLPSSLSAFNYFRAVREELADAAEVLFPSGYGRPWFAELLFPPELRRICILTYDTFVSPAMYGVSVYRSNPSHEMQFGSMDFVLTNPQRAGVLASNNPEFAAKGKILSTSFLGPLSVEIERAMAHGPSGLAEIPSGSEAIIVLACLRLGRYLESTDVSSLIRQSPPKTHFVFVGTNDHGPTREAIERGGHTCQFVPFSSNLPSLFLELQESKKPAIFFSPSEDRYSGGTKRIAADYLPYVGISPCHIDIDPKLTFDDFNQAFDEVRRLFNWTSS